ncbi:DUF805 domain-containing protein [Streptomyces sp. TS71-3]|uniref:DUF805 domain-containing protein n=1 Tax=Streptomyces sp. TS71-3 TaxID=2733862 RepID=UPI001B006E8C|nr:DUF805 domain-containing protein [Streptomyces sp. TS71-3]GHJ36635.1 DUF805 domain-containing protein [Streptomyces sp. TS71-3]
MHWYMRAWKLYGVFGGRASRVEYWMFVLIDVIVSLALFAVDTALQTRVPDTIYGLAAIVPSLAVGCRRLHDTDRSGWWQLLNLIPVLGWIAVIVLMAQDGTHGANKHGPDPRHSAVHGAAAHAA